MAFEAFYGIVHTHCCPDTIGALAGRDLPTLRQSSDADYFYGAVSSTRLMPNAENNGGYEWEIGQVIIETFRHPELDPEAGVVIAHDPFAWGSDAKNVPHNAVLLEKIPYIGIFPHKLSPGMLAI